MHGNTSNIGSMTCHVVVAIQGDQIHEVWAEGGSGAPLSEQDAAELAEWANAQPGNERHHQAVAVTVPGRG